PAGMRPVAACVRDRTGAHSASGGDCPTPDRGLPRAIMVDPASRRRRRDMENRMALITRRNFAQALAGSAALAGLRPRRASAADKIHIGILPLTSHAPTIIAQ